MTPSGMGEGFVNKVEVDASVDVVAIHGFQTGNVSQKWRSRQAAENNDRILPFHFLLKRKGVSACVKPRDIGDGNIDRE